MTNSIPRRAGRVLPVLLAVAFVLMSAPALRAQCGAADIVFVLDSTGSMGGALDNVKADMGNLVNEIASVTGGDYRMALVEVKDQIVVHNTLTSTNGEAVKTSIAALTASGGANEPEMTDEALNTVVNALAASSRPSGMQSGDFTAFRSDAQKIVILVTDARPSGFDDQYVEGVDDVHAHEIALQAASKGVQLSTVFVPTPFSTSSGTAETVRKVLRDYSATSGGRYIEANSDGTGTATAISAIIKACNGAKLFVQADPVSTQVSTDETGDFLITVTALGEFTSPVVLGATPIPDGATVSFDPPTLPAPGTGTSLMHFTPGDATLPGNYFVGVIATSEEAGSNASIVKVNVDCRAPFIYGTSDSQPQSQTVTLGQPALLHVVANGSGPLKYQWYRGESGGDYFPITGANGATYVTPPVSSRANFWVRVTNPCGTYDSFTATVAPTGQGGAAVPDHRGRPTRH